MNKNILLIEPNYKNKYPPLGLMKISTYHKLKGDNVTFFKGLSKNLQSQRWDRIYVTTLFSFHWKKTIETIKFYKRSVIKTKDFLVGGILATTMYDKLYEETGIKPFKGLLDKPDLLGKDKKKYIVDELTPDYDILESIDYKYPTSNSYITYMTRGCCNNCAFCAVPALEPTYKHFISIKNQVRVIDEKYGEKKDLLLMDNNVLASSSFDQIIDEIIELGFGKDAKYIEPNYFELYYNRLLISLKDEIAWKKLDDYLFSILSRINVEKLRIEFKLSLEKLIDLKDDKNESFNFIKANHDNFYEITEKYRNKAPKQRYVDFNQGVDARKINEHKMKRLSEINLRPLRIAFDDIKFKNIYIKQIRLAEKYEIKNLSNYVLYNFKDTPSELYERLRINIDLNKELNLQIFSFPMKYIPIDSKDRDFIGDNWNRKFLRTIQAILNVTHGSVMPKKPFFEKAFGKNIKEFNYLLYMPEDYVYYRYYCEDKRIGLTQSWKKAFRVIEKDRKKYSNIFEIIESNNFKNLDLTSFDKSEKNVLIHYVNRVNLKEFNKWKLMQKEEKGNYK